MCKYVIFDKSTRTKIREQSKIFPNVDFMQMNIPKRIHFNNQKIRPLFTSLNSNHGCLHERQSVKSQKIPKITWKCTILVGFKNFRVSSALYMKKMNENSLKKLLLYEFLDCVDLINYDSCSMQVLFFRSNQFYWKIEFFYGNIPIADVKKFN